MKITVKYKNGQMETIEVSQIKLQNKNPCVKCRNNGGCYDHGCFMPEDCGDFLVSTHHEIRIQDVDNIYIKEF
jgi:hypothetical protein